MWKYGGSGGLEVVFQVENEKKNLGNFSTKFIFMYRLGE
jgi:hypothetical protein